jgi:glycosyltransferase involved in cell wall biosynthesis
VVAANRGGIPDIVSDGINGCLYEPDGADGGGASLIAATGRLLGDPAQQRQLGLEARREAERWGWAAATAQLRGYYQQVLQPAAVTL